MVEKPEGRGHDGPELWEWVSRWPCWGGVRGELVLEVEDLGQLPEALVGREVEVDEELGHLRLPAGVHVGAGHARLRGGEVRRLEVADEQAVLAQEEGVVGPAGVVEGAEHLGPHGGVALGVLLHAVRADLQLEADTVHRTLLSGGGRSRDERWRASSTRRVVGAQSRGRRRLESDGPGTWWFDLDRGQKSKSPMLSALKVNGSPSRTTPSAPTSNSPRSPASKESPSSPEMSPLARAAAA